jgi:hypothetical protein
MNDEIVVTPFAVGESTEHEILSKAVQDGSASHQPIVTEVADNVSNANDADGAQRDDEAHSSNENSEADRGQEGMAGHQNASVKGGEGQVSEKSVPASKRCSLMERNPNASTYEVLPPFQIIKCFGFSRFTASTTY